MSTVLVGGSFPCQLRDTFRHKKYIYAGGAKFKKFALCATVRQGEHSSRGRQIAWNGTERKPLDNQYIFQLVLQQKVRLTLASISLVACVASNLASPVISGLLFEMLVTNAPFHLYSKLLAILMASYIIEPFLTKVFVGQVCAIGERVQILLRLEAFRIILMQKIEFFDKHRATELTSLLTRDLESFRQFIFSNVSRDRGLRALGEVIGSVLVLFWLSWRLGPVLAGVILATGTIAWIYKRQSKALEHSSAMAHARMTNCVSETVSHIRTVRIYSGEALERERYGQYAADAYEAGLGFANAKGWLECLNRTAIHISLLCLYGLGGFYVSKGLVPVRVMLSAIGFTYSLIFATQGLLQTWTDARSCSAALSRVQRTLSELTVDESMSDALPPGAWWDKANKIQGTCPAFEEEDGEPDGEPEEISKRTEGRVQGTAVSALAAARSGDLVMSNVDFSYPVRPDYPVLKNLSLTLPRGKVTAIVGRSGAGKSTVASLIERLYPLDRGSIKLNGVDIARFTRQEWVNAVTAVSQEPVLFSGTIFENIAYGRPHASVAEVEKAALAANAHDFILSLPEAYESVVGDRGVLLSGGQRQRVALARALLQDAPILILDEATSALDGESERLVQQAIENLVANRTVLIIAHRLSTVQAADQILVMDDGRIVEQGTHVELLRLEGMYKKLVSSQALTLSASVGSLP